MTTERIALLETFFKNTKLPKQIKLNLHTNITDVAKFVHSHLQTASNNIGNKTFVSYYDRLEELKTLLETTPTTQTITNP